VDPTYKEGGLEDWMQP
jgi:hypothetical protein